MAKIEFFAADQREFVPFAALVGVDEAMVERLLPGERRGSVCMRHPGHPDQPQLFEICFPAHTVVESHAHRVDEIVVITDGELHFGNRVFGPGSSIMIPKMTLYAFNAGPTGVKFYNFRPRDDLGYLSKEELLASRATDPTVSVAAH